MEAGVTQKQNENKNEISQQLKVDSFWGLWQKFFDLLLLKL